MEFKLDISFKQLLNLVKKLPEEQREILRNLLTPKSKTEMNDEASLERPSIDKRIITTAK